MLEKIFTQDELAYIYKIINNIIGLDMQEFLVNKKYRVISKYKKYIDELDETTRYNNIRCVPHSSFGTDLDEDLDDSIDGSIDTDNTEINTPNIIISGDSEQLLNGKQGQTRCVECTDNCYSYPTLSFNDFEKIVSTDNSVVIDLNNSDNIVEINLNYNGTDTEDMQVSELVSDSNISIEKSVFGSTILKIFKNVTETKINKAYYTFEIYKTKKSGYQYKLTSVTVTHSFDDDTIINIRQRTDVYRDTILEIFYSSEQSTKISANVYHNNDGIKMINLFKGKDQISILNYCDEILYIDSTDKYKFSVDKAGQGLPISENIVTRVSENIIICCELYTANNIAVILNESKKELLSKFYRDFNKNISELFEVIEDTASELK